MTCVTFLRCSRLSNRTRLVLVSQNDEDISAQESSAEAVSVTVLNLSKTIQLRGTSSFPVYPPSFLALQLHGPQESFSLVLGQSLLPTVSPP